MMDSELERKKELLTPSQEGGREEGVHVDSVYLFYA